MSPSGKAEDSDSSIPWVQILPPQPIFFKNLSKEGFFFYKPEVFIKSYNRMLSEIEPEKIICYSKPFAEMTGDILYVDYELSSWKYLDNKSSEYLQNKTFVI